MLSFVSSLTEADLPSHFTNPYKTGHTARNLLLFLTRRDRLAWTLLAIGEAPGYRGAVMSGVPLSSLATLADPWGDPWESFGPSKGYSFPPNPLYWREATATIIWESFAMHLADSPLPLTWNAVPFHPQKNGRASNASLRANQLHIGQPWIERLLELFPNVFPVAVGRRACETLCQLKVDHEAIRHPSRGGKQEFSMGLARVRSLMSPPPATSSLTVA